MTTAQEMCSSGAFRCTARVLAQQASGSWIDRRPEQSDALDALWVT